jgi:hypothetical protein
MPIGDEGMNQWNMILVIPYNCIAFIISEISVGWPLTTEVVCRLVRGLVKTGRESEVVKSVIYLLKLWCILASTLIHWAFPCTYDSLSVPRRREVLIYEWRYPSSIT